MNTSHWLKIAITALIALQLGLFTTQARERGLDSEVIVAYPPGLVKKVEPEYPSGFVVHGVGGRGIYRLTINSKSGLVDEVKIVKSTGYRELNELAVKALLQWRFQPGTASPIQVPVEFYAHGGHRVLH